MHTSSSLFALSKEYPPVLPSEILYSNFLSNDSNKPLKPFTCTSPSSTTSKTSSSTTSSDLFPPSKSRTSSSSFNPLPLSSSPSSKLSNTSTLFSLSPSQTSSTCTNFMTTTVTLSPTKKTTTQATSMTSSTLTSVTKTHNTSSTHWRCPSSSPTVGPTTSFPTPHSPAYLPVTPPSSQSSPLPTTTETTSCYPSPTIRGNPNQIINHSYRLFQSSTIIDTISSIRELSFLSQLSSRDRSQYFEELLLLNDFHITPNLTLWLYSTVGLMVVPQHEVQLAKQRLLQLLSNIDSTLSTRLYLLPTGFSMIDIVFAISLFPAFRNLLNQSTCLPLAHISNWFIRCVSNKSVQLVYEKLMLSPSASLASSNKHAAWPTKVTIDDYSIIRVLGKGCMGKVLLVRHKKSGSLYAMKSISKSSVIAHKELDHTLAERKILSTIAQIQHPFLVQCHNAFTSERELFLVLDFVSGGDMATQLAKFGRLPPNRVQFYACEIVLGLCELHRLGIVYRDLKPENILLTPDGHVVLTDFGLSKMVSPTKNRTKTFAGTAEYLAPEILKNQEYGFEVDWWSFGTLLYEMFFGVTPFWAENQALMYKRVLEDPLLFPKFMPMDIQSLIAGLLERNPCHRLTGTLVQSHGYFKCIDWNNVYSKKIPVPYVPSLRSPMDVSNFEDVFTSMSPRLSPATHDLSASLQASFAGYSWAPSAPIHEQTQVGSSNGKSLVAVEAPSTMVTSHPPPPPSPPLPPSVSTTSTSTFTRFQKMTPSMPFINHSTLLSTSSTSPTLPQKIKSTPLPTQHSSSFAIQQCVSPLYSSFTIQEENEEMLYDQDIMIKDADEKSIQPVEEEEEEQDLLALDFTTPENEENAGSPYFDVLTSPPSTMLTPISCSTVAVSSSPSSSCITKATSPSSTISSPTLSSANYTTKGTSSPTTSSTTTTSSTPFSGVMPSTQPSPVLHHPSPYSHSPLQGPSLTLLSSQAQGPTTLTFSRSTHTKSQAMVGTTLTAKTTTFMNAPAPSHWTPQPTFLASQKYASFA